MAMAPVAISVSSTPNTISLEEDEKSSFTRRSLNTRQSPTPTPAPAAKPNMAVLLASGAIDTLVNWIGANPTGGIPIALKKAVTVSITDVQDGFGEFYLKTKNRVLGDISTVMANYLQEVAAGYKAAAGALLGTTAPKVAANIEGRAVRRLSAYTDFSMTSEEADAVMEALIKEVKHPGLAANLAKEMPRVIANLNGSTAKDAVFASQKSVKDVGLDKPFFSSSPIAPLQGALMTAGPTIMNGIKTTVVKGMNGGMDSLKRTVPIFDWYKFYLGHMCWGFYKHDPKSGKITEEIMGCGTTAKWKDINLAPIVQKMLNASGIMAKAPPQIGLGNGLETTFEGLRKFTGLIYGTGVLTIVNITFALVVTLAAIGATGFVDAGMLKNIYFVALNLGAGAMCSIYITAIVMTISLGGAAFIMPGTGVSVGAVVSVGGGFLVLLWLNSILAVIGFGAWMMMWLSLVREEEFEKGRVSGTSMITMVNGYEIPKHG